MFEGRNSTPDLNFLKEKAINIRRNILISLATAGS